MTSGIFDLSKTPANNVDIGGVAVTVGAMAPSNVGPALRALAAMLKKWQEDFGGALTTTGSADAYVLDVNSNPYSGAATFADGDTFAFIANFTNSGPATLNVEAEGAKAIRKLNDQPLAAGDIVQGSAYTVHYDASVNASAGGWILENPIGNYQPLDASLTAYAALTTAANKFLTFSAADTPVASDITANGLSLVGAADYAAMKALLDLEIGMDIQAFDSDLTAWAGKTAPSGTVIGHTDTQTLTNKTIDTAANAVSNIATSMFATNVVDTDTSLAANSDTRLGSQRAIKAYVDTTAAGINWAVGGAVGNATTANITLSGEQTLDGVLTSTSRILVKNQTAPAENGIYVTAAGAWARATDADAGAEFVRLGVFVNAGTTQAGTTWVCTRTTAPTVGVDAIAFVQNGASAVYTAGTGLGQTGNQFNVIDAELLALLGLTSAADKLPYFSGSGTAALADFNSAARTLLTDASGVYRSGGTDVAVVDGGTGGSTATAGFNALSPVTTRGDIIVRGATNNQRLALGSSGKVLKSDGTDTVWGYSHESFVIACSDETTAITATTGKVEFRMPYAFTVTAVRASLTTAQSSGSIFTVDINESGTTILSTRLTIDNTEKTSTTAAAAAVISDTALADDAIITIDVDQIGNGTAKGLKIYIIGTRA